MFRAFTSSITAGRNRESVPVMLGPGKVGAFAALRLGWSRPKTSVDYINQMARAGSWHVPAGPYRDRLRLGPGLAKRAGTTRPGARAYTTITRRRGGCPEIMSIIRRRSHDARLRPLWLGITDHHARDDHNDHPGRGSARPESFVALRLPQPR